MTALQESLAAATRVTHGAGSEADKQMVCGDFILLAAQVPALLAVAKAASEYRRTHMMTLRGPVATPDERVTAGQRLDAALASWLAGTKETNG